MKTKKQTVNYSAKSEVSQFKTKKSFSHVAKRELKKAPFTAWLGMIITSAYILIAVFAPLIAPYGESEVFPIPFAPPVTTAISFLRSRGFKVILVAPDSEDSCQDNLLHLRLFLHNLLELLPLLLSDKLF